MRSEWTRARLGDLVSIRHGWPFKGELFSTDRLGRPIVVSIGNFQYTGGFRFEQTQTKEYAGEYPRAYELSPGNILLVMTCQTVGGEILGIPARVPNDGRIYLHNQRMGLVAPRGNGSADLNFLYWLFLGREFNQHLVSSATGTKILHTAPSRIESFEFDLPPVAEQRAIARILGALEDKIELNRKTNATLEALARALFKSWFVDFVPVHSKADGRAPSGMDAETANLFPNELVESQLGPIPRGWTVVPLHTMSSHLSRGIGPVYLEVGGVCVLNQKCIRDHRLDVTKARRHDASKKSVDGRLLQRLDILVNSTGVGTLGRVAQVWNLAEDTIVDSHVTVVRAANSVNPWFLGVGMLEREAEIEALGEGSTGQTELSRVRLGGLPWLRPPEALQHQFGDAVATQLQRIVTNDRESYELTRIRDELLPRLLSGEVSVADAQQTEATS